MKYKEKIKNYLLTETEKNNDFLLKLSKYNIDYRFINSKSLVE